eukprot:PITA_26189
MVEEYNSIMVNNFWEVVSRPQDRSVVGSRWISKIKYAVDNNVEKYKARFVAKGYAQKEGINYKETFALKMGFVKRDVDPNLYYLVLENELLILVLYVDDLFRTGSSRRIEDWKKNLATEFDMKDLGRMHYFLGLEVWQEKTRMSIPPYTDNS